MLQKQVKNLSKYKTTDHKLKLLSKGANFAISLTEIPVKEYVAQMEMVFSCLLHNKVNELHSDMRGLLATAN